MGQIPCSFQTMLLKCQAQLEAFKAKTPRCMLPLAITKVLRTLLMSQESDDNIKGKIQFTTKKLLELEIEANTTVNT